MQPEHDASCDEQHLPRQQCNTALAPAVGQRDTAVPVVTPIAAPAPDEDPASSAIRETVAMAHAPQPTVYVSREWERTAAAVGPREAAVVDADERSKSGGMRRAAMVVVAIAVVLVTVRGVRGRRGERV